MNDHIWKAKYNKKSTDDIKSKLLEVVLWEKVAGILNTNKNDKSFHITKVLKEINAEPIFYQKGDAFLLILIDTNFVLLKYLLKREWGVIGKEKQTAVEIFETKKEAKERRDLIISHKLRQGYKPIF